jgi:hypothetical protein
MVLPTGSTRKGRIQRLPQAFRCNGIPQGSMALLLVFRALPHRRPRRRTELNTTTDGGDSRILERR